MLFKFIFKVYPSTNLLCKLRAEFTKKDEMELPLVVFINYHKLKTEVCACYNKKNFLAFDEINGYKIFLAFEEINGYKISMIYFRRYTRSLML